MIRVPIDKRAHFLAGAATASTAALYGMPPGGALALVVGIAAAKEVWDGFGHGTPEVADFIATVLGAIVLLPLALTIMR